MAARIGLARHDGMSQSGSIRRKSFDGLDRFGSFWFVLVHFDNFWFILGFPQNFSSKSVGGLDHFGTFWYVPVRPGTSRDAVGRFGTFWDVPHEQNLFVR